VRVAIIGAGPAGLAAAERLAEAGAAVTVFDRMASPARKFLLAGRGGLNITHSEPLDRFLDRYGPARARLEPAIRAFPPEALREWCHGLGQETFIGSSGRVFPTAFKAAPLLRAWLRRLDGLGVRLQARAQWEGWSEDGAIRFADGRAERPDAVLLALGGASWPRMGSDGGWAPVLAAQGARVQPFSPANAGVLIAWSDLLRERHAGTPLKRIALSVGEARVRGEAVLTRSGLEGGAVYALSAPIRLALAGSGPVLLHMDLRPDLSVEDCAARLAAPRRGQSLSNHLRRSLALPPVAVALLREVGPVPQDSGALAVRIKALPLPLTGFAGLDRAISTAGGIDWPEVSGDYALLKRPGTFVAGEMLDWEAPTGGYLLQACFATGRAAAEGILRHLASRG
jgi:uncharacterized flavoprotein (TIGR03862 family)